MLVLGGTVGVVLAVVPLGTGADVRLRVPPGSAVPLPSSGLFATSGLVLYGRPGGAERPDDGDLGCDVTTEDGSDVGLKVSSLRALRSGERVVGGETLTPLATVRDFEGGWLFSCAGPAATTAQPLYLLAEGRRPVPRSVAAAFGVTGLVLGAAALAVAGRTGGPALNGGRPGPP